MCEKSSSVNMYLKFFSVFLLSVLVLACVKNTKVNYTYDENGVTNKSRTTGSSDIMQALKNHDLQKAKSLLPGCDVNVVDVNGRTLLHYAAKYTDDEKFISKVIAKKANINARDNKGLIPLSYSRDAANNKVSAMLLLEGSEKIDLGVRRYSVEHEINVMKAWLIKEKRARRIALAKKQKCKLKLKGWYYTGKQCKKGLAHGNGAALHEKGVLEYKGRFSNGFFLTGKLIRAGSVEYSGGFRGEKPHGSGTCLYGRAFEKCKFYKGRRIDGIHKQRMAINNKRIEFSGDFRGEKFHGKGMCYYPDGEKEVCQFTHGLMIKGRYFEQGQLVFENGQYINGKPHGSGICFYGNAAEKCKYNKGRRIDGAHRQRLAIRNQRIEFSGREKLHGKGMCYYPDGEKGVCQFNHGLMVKGRYFEQGQLVVEGSQYKNGKPHGSGICFYENAPEKCEFYKGSRIDALYKQRVAMNNQAQEMNRQSEEMATMREEIKRLRSSQNNSRRAVPAAAGGTSGGDRLANCAALLLKKKACDHIGGFGGMACMALIPGGHNCF